LGNDILDGGEGHDQVAYLSASGAVQVTLTATGGTATGAAGNDTLVSIEDVVGSNFNDVLTGNDNLNSLIGADGHDLLLGGGGDDFLIGENGDDSLDGGLGADLLDGGAGNDTASYTNAISALSVTLTETGGSAVTGTDVDTLISIENVTGSQFGDFIAGNSASNILSGGGFEDTLDGGLGDDILDGGSDSDTVTYANASGEVFVALTATGGLASGAAGNDTLISIENVTGSAFSDFIFGNGGANILDGFEGNDSLDGGLGADTLTGGEGSDLFGIGANSGNDTIADFTDLDTILFDALSGVDDFLDLVLVDKAGNTLVTWGTDDSLLIKGVNVDDMDASDFAFQAGSAFSSGLAAASGPDAATSHSHGALADAHADFAMSLSHGSTFGAFDPGAHAAAEMAATAFLAG
jgi:Ca2+-binding RTX toxin-like protein